MGEREEDGRKKGSGIFLTEKKKMLLYTYKGLSGEGPLPWVTSKDNMWICKIKT